MQSKSIVKNSVKIVLCIFLLMVFVQGVQAAETYSFVTKWGSSGSGDGQFSTPEGVAVDSSDNVYVADYSNNRIQKFSSDGTFITKWGAYGSGDGQFYPHSVAVDSSGNVYVADSDGININRIQKFSSTGTFITKWGSSGSGDGQFYTPGGLAIDSSGNVFVADWGNNRIQKFSSTGTFITKWGAQTGTGNGQFFHPGGVAIDASGNVFVADTDNHRIQKFTSDGTFITKWGSYDSGDGQFKYPRGIAVDLSGNVFVSDSYNHRVQKFGSAGAFLTKWGTEGSGDGQFEYPYGVAVDSANNIYIADNRNYRIQKFAPDPAYPPVANFTGTPTSGTAPLTVTFTDTSTNTPKSWSWNFGDGSSVNSTQRNPVHTYATIGTYTVKLTATNSAGSNIFTRTNYITVNSPVVTPVASFTGTPTTGKAPLIVTFTDTSTNNPTSWSWNFGDGSADTSQNPSHTYSSAGNYTVALTAINSAGSNLSTRSGYITVTSDVTPPSITITSPKARTKFTTATITVKGTASDNVGLSKVEVKVGSGVWQTATGTTSWSKSVTLARVLNKITARATDTSGNFKDTSVMVIYNK